ncbi:MAG: NYN domain-containing protein [Patescibacteria group bacterium]
MSIASSDTRGNYAFIDSQNLNLGIRSLGWFLSFRRFRVYLAEKYGVKKAYVFIGYMAGNTQLYNALQDAGFVCVFKPTLTYKDGTTKGNCDAELVLQAMIDFAEYDQAVLVSGDGDFYCLAKHLIEQNKLAALLIPNKFKFSALLKFVVIRPFLRFMNDLERKLAYKKEKTPQGRNLEG